MPSTAARVRVLIVDDDPLVQSLLEAVLEGDRFEVDSVADGESALARADAHAPDAVILDVMMPGIDGYEVCRRLRANRHTADARVVILTAKPAVPGREDAEAAGADAFFTKPFSPLELLETLCPTERPLAS